MNGPKTKGGLRKTVRQIEDEFGVDKDVEDIVDSILSIFESDDEESSGEDGVDYDEEDSTFQNDDDDSGDFGDGDFGGGGSSDDW